VKDGKVRITFLGSTKQVRDFIELLKDADIRYKVVLHTDAKFSPHSLMSRLTEKQQKTLITAHALGYYDIPNRIGLLQLAKRLDLSRATVDMQLRRAERRLLNHIMNES
jgi:predicted DNA binding protein